MAGETILLVEDNDAVALGLIYGLEKEGYTVRRAATAAAASQHTAAPDFDLLILDIRLPDGNGFDLCREFRAAGLRQPILMLTARDEIIDKVIGLELGADDYVTKPFELRELVARIRSLLRRSYGPLAEGGHTRLNVGDLSLDLAGQRVTRGQQEIHLTATEFKLLAFLAQNPDRPFDRETLIERIWGYDEFVGDARTVDVHIRNLRQKIEPDPAQPRLIVTVRGAGYKLVIG
ncbi:MAG: response regulator transcription factor [Chloroflexi bacterium]|nr:response regulator transcription factor [Chloroflexota bacterium]